MLPLRTRPKWPNAKECCGREIQTTRLGRKRAWYAQGPIFDKFEQALVPEIVTFLRNTDLKDAEIYFRMYMIGKTEETSRPTIMVCCKDVPMGRRAKDSLRDSRIIRDNPGIALGSIDNTLEALVPVQGLASEIKTEILHKVLETGFNSASEAAVFAISQHPTMGRRLFVAQPRAHSAYRYSTGGVVVSAHGRFYQLTVGHINDLQDCTETSSSMDPDACSFDGQSDSEGEDNYSLFEQNMRRASMSMMELSDSESAAWEIESSSSGTVNCGSPASPDYITTNSDATGNFSHAPDEIPGSSPLLRVGKIALHSKDGGQPNLDYALVSIQTPQEGDAINEISLGKEQDSTTLRIHGVAPVSREERRIIAATGSGGIMKGVLIPGTTFLGKANQQQPQKLHIVQLDGEVAEGDSGTAVVDETSGDLYGYIISGCPGTRVAYIVPATDVFEDLGTELNGQVSIVSARKMQKSPRAFDANEQKSNLTNHQPQDAYGRDEPLGDHHRADATSTLGSRQTCGCTEHNLRQGRPIGSMYKAWDSLFSGSPSLDVPLRVNRPPFIQDSESFEDPISFLIQEFQDQGYLSLGSEDTAAFLKDVPLTRLLRGECCYGRVARRVALIDDRCGDGQLGKSRINRGPLTAYGLYHELRKPRFCAGPTRKLGLHDEPDAERRVIYVTNLDHWSVAALLATVSMSEAPAVASLIEKRLEWRSSLQVSISPRVDPMFLLEFHFPFFIWRTSKVQFEDHRRGADGRPLRKVLDVSFLHAGSSNAVSSHGIDYLSEAQISCVVTGYSNRIWTAYGLVDTYFDPESCDDAVNFYENLGFEDDEELDEYKLDLMTRGRYDANLPMRDPREYFLAVCETRLHQVTQAWRDVIYRTQRRIKSYMSDNECLTYRGKDPYVDATAVHMSHEWVIQALKLLRKMQESLSDLTFQWQKFNEGEVDYLVDEVGSAKARILLSIEHIFNEMKALERILYQLETRCNDFLKLLELRLLLGGNDLAERQQKLTNTVGNTTLVLLYMFFPSCLAAVMLSMQSSAIPINTSFIVLALSLFAVMWIATLLHSNGWIQGILSSLLVKPVHEDMHIETDFQSHAPGVLEPPRVAKCRMTLKRLLGWRRNEGTHDREIELGFYP